jgi:hypothetical protein
LAKKIHFHIHVLRKKNIKKEIMLQENAEQNISVITTAVAGGKY